MPRIISYAELKPRFGIRWTRKHIIELVRAGRFPHPVHLGGQTVGWPENEIDDWLKARIAERDLSSKQPRDIAPPEKPTQRKRLATKPRKRAAETASANNEVTT